MSLKSMFDRPEKTNPTTAKNPADPASKAAAVWDNRVGSVAVQAHNWRRATLLLGVACCVLAGGLVAQSLKTQVIPYPILINEQTGEVKQAGAFTQNDYKPTENVIKYFICDFIKNARTVLLDPVAQDLNQKKALAFLTQNSAQKYFAVQQNENFNDKYGEITVSIHIVSITRVPESETSYQVRWTEEEYGIKNGSKNVVNMSGVFTYVMLPVSEKQAMLFNPLGLYISGFDFMNDVNQINKK